MLWADTSTFGQVVPAGALSLPIYSLSNAAPIPVGNGWLVAVVSFFVENIGTISIDPVVVTGDLFLRLRDGNGTLVPTGTRIAPYSEGFVQALSPSPISIWPGATLTLEGFVNAPEGLFGAVALCVFNAPQAAVPFENSFFISGLNIAGASVGTFTDGVTLQEVAGKAFATTYQSGLIDFTFGGAQTNWANLAQAHRPPDGGVTQSILATTTGTQDIWAIGSLPAGAYWAAVTLVGEVSGICVTFPGVTGTINAVDASGVVLAVLAQVFIPPNTPDTLFDVEQVRLPAGTAGIRLVTTIGSSAGCIELVARTIGTAIVYTSSESPRSCSATIAHITSPPPPFDLDGGPNVAPYHITYPVVNDPGAGNGGLIDFGVMTFSHDIPLVTGRAWGAIIGD